MKLINLIISATLAVMLATSMAQSQDLMGFDRASFGSVVLSRTQAVGTGIQLELSVGSYENEPMSNYKDTVFADIGRSVGRLDVLTDKGTFPCTAFIVSKQHILTNYHCSLGLLGDERIGATRIDASQFVAGYTQTGVDEGTKKFTVIPTPVETNAELDYAVLEVIGNPSQEFGELKLASLVPKDRAPFWIIGHPQGKGQHISREKCRASTPAVSRNTLLHTCDTLPGNSGSPVIDAGLQQVVALHHAGIANDSVNAAILMSKILEHSTVLAAYKAPEEVPKSQPMEPKAAAIDSCDALYSAAAEAKACYAYDVYINSCPAHMLAPMARGYINEFCQPKETAKVEKPPEKTCDDDPSLCSTDQLCGQSLTFKSGKAAWRMDNASYVTEAKRRRLTCGVTEVVAQPKKTCSKHLEVCSDGELCSQASIWSRNEKVWAENIFYRKFVQEAKRRGLACGVTEAVAKDDEVCYHNLENCTIDQLCRVATSTLGGKKIWYDVSTFYKNYVTEAKRRGLACGVIEAVSQPKKSCPDDVKYCSKNQICTVASNGVEGQRYWTKNVLFFKYVTEAKRRGLSCGVTETVTKRSALQACPSDQSRRYHNCFGTYTFADGNKYVGEFKADAYHGQGTYTFAAGAKYVGQYKDGKYNGQGTYTFADGNKYVGQQKDDKRNGQGFFFFSDGRADFCTYADDKDSNCIGTNAYDVAVTLKKQFSALPNSQRKAIQSTLKRRNFYTSSIDGKWGRGTLMALVEFSSINLGTVDLQSASASKKLLDAVLR